MTSSDTSTHEADSCRSADSGAAGDPVTQSQSAYVTLLFNKYRGQLHKYLTRFVSTEDAGDLVQETYFRVVRQGNTVQLEALARALLFRTATNLARDLRRRRTSHLADRHIPLEDEDLAVCSIGPGEHLAGEQVLDVLEQALAQMPPDVRRVFILCRFQELNYSEVGAAMGLSTRTVARKMADAIERLGAAMRAFL